MVLVCWLQDYITKADLSASELCESSAKCGATNPSLPREGIARPELLPEFVCTEMPRRRFNEQCSQETSEGKDDLSHKICFARVFWPKELNSVPFLSLGWWSSSEIPAGQNRCARGTGRRRWGVCGNDTQLTWFSSIYPMPDLGMTLSSPGLQNHRIPE